MLNKLATKLHEYNQTHGTAWAMMFCTPNAYEVYIVDEEDNSKSPEWWGDNKEPKNLERALELVPQKYNYAITVFNKETKTSRLHEITEDQLLKIAEILQ